MEKGPPIKRFNETQLSMKSMVKAFRTRGQGVILESRSLEVEIEEIETEVPSFIVQPTLSIVRSEATSKGSVVLAISTQPSHPNRHTYSTSIGLVDLKFPPISRCGGSCCVAIPSKIFFGDFAKRWWWCAVSALYSGGVVVVVVGDSGIDAVVLMVVMGVR
ncbi:Hypothetical predicted protein [Olea europaea subsp. europaea]|uniref:Uncharacterized protein n=1 Tax=Olea europaea subsp. europaea TaxID=158383 RepID=A0A8S0SCW8_OLEEU|nr:Hypothetical predicted protein [Olea europaea subsp. europaea]